MSGAKDAHNKKQPPAAAGTGELDYESEKALARSENISVRRELAGRADARPEILYYLTTDPAVPVRQALAANPATPRQADAVLSRDQEAAVRGELALKIARLVPDLSLAQLDQIGQLTLEILETLVRDQAATVRQTIAETLKESSQVPKAVIDRLARDLEIAVAEPILRCSPLLTDEDLLSIIASSPIGGALGAIAKRRAVHEPVSDAIAQSDDTTAITALLANPSAQIREATLDHLIDRAPHVAEWHAPLVHRPSLTVRAIQRMTKFVADALLDFLSERPDIDAATAQKLKQTVTERLKAKSGEAAHNAAAPKAKEAPAPKTPPKKPAKKSGKKDGKAKEKAESYEETQMSLALDQSNYDYIRRGLAARNEVPLTIVEKVLTSQSPRGVVALVWRAGLSMRFALQVQKQIAHIHPTQILNARGGFDYPMNEDEMIWQLDFFGVPKTPPKSAAKK